MSQDGQPFAGLKVIDLASFVAGPAAATMLGDFGADVVKIEQPGEGDPHRRLGEAPSVPQHPVNFCWELTSRNKRSLSLDLKNPAGRAVFERLVADADVLVSNFPPPVRERLSIRHADLAPLNPRLIYASLTGYGETGPDAGQPGFDATAFFARAGILDSLRYEGAAPGFAFPGQGDQMTAVTLFGAIVMALWNRERTGRGAEVGTSLLAAGLWSGGLIGQGALLGAFVAPRPPRTRPRSALGNLYRARDDRWFSLAVVREEKLWPGFCAALGRPDLERDARFATRESRRAHATDLAAVLDAIFAADDWPAWRDKLRAAGITFGVVGRMQDIPDDPQAVACGAVIEGDQPGMPRTLANPIRVDFARQRRPQAAPATPGIDNDAVLRDAGYGVAEIDALRAAGALG